MPCSSVIWVWMFLNIIDNLKKLETTDIWMEDGDFQLGTGSTCCHFFSSTNEVNSSLSRVPRYWRKTPSLTLYKFKEMTQVTVMVSVWWYRVKRKTYWYIVGRAVTMKRPLRPGEVVTSTCPTVIPRSSPHEAKSFQTGSRALHAGHHGA